MDPFHILKAEKYKIAKKYFLITIHSNSKKKIKKILQQKQEN